MSKLDFALYGSMVVTLVLVMVSNHSLGAWPYALLGGVGAAAVCGLSFKALRLWPMRQGRRGQKAP